MAKRHEKSSPATAPTVARLVCPTQPQRRNEPVKPTTTPKRAANRDPDAPIAYFPTDLPIRYWPTPRARSAAERPLSPFDAKRGAS